jgi:WD40 repeat protein
MQENTTGMSSYPTTRPYTTATFSNTSVPYTGIYLQNSFYVYGESVKALVAAPYGYLASAGTDRTIKIWNTNSFYQERVLYGHTDSISCLALLNNNYLASGGDDKSLRIWDEWSGSQITGISAHTSSVQAIAVLPGNYLATASADYSIKLWSMNNRVIQYEKSMLGHLSDVNALALLQESYLLASGSNDATIRIWQWNNGTTVKVLYNLGAVLCLQVMHNGSLASGGIHGAISIWNPYSGRLIRTLSPSFYSSGWVTALSLLANGDLISGYSEGIIVVWDKYNFNIKSVVYSHSSPIYSLAILDDERFASAGDNYINVLPLF